MPASVNPKLMWLGATPAHRRNKTPSKPGGNYETVDQPPAGYVIPPNEGGLVVKVAYVQTAPMMVGLSDLKRWYDGSTPLPAFDISQTIELSSAHKVELWPYFTSKEEAVASSPAGIVVAVVIDLTQVADSEFPLTISGQLTQIGGNATNVTTGMKLYGPLDPSTNTVIDSRVVTLAEKAGPIYFYMGVKWQPSELLDDIVYRANVKIVGQTDKLDTYTGMRVVTCGKEVEWKALTPVITDQYELMQHGTTADPEQQKAGATMYLNYQWSSPGSGATSMLAPAFSPIYTETPMSLNALEFAPLAPPSDKVPSLEPYLKAAHEAMFGTDMCFREPLDETHCETKFTLEARVNPSYFGPLPHSEVRTYTSPDGKQTIDKVCLTYAGAGYMGILGGNIGTSHCEYQHSDTGTVLQAHNPIPNPEGAGTWFNQTMFMTPQLGMIAERYSQIADPDSSEWPGGVGKPGFWMETQDGFVQVPYEHFDRLLPNATQSADGVTYNLDTQKLLDYLGTTEGAPLGDTPVNLSFSVTPQNVDWEAIQLAKNVEIFWNSGTLSVSQEPTTWQNIKNGAKLILNVVSTISALASGAALGAAVIRYGATALGGGNVVLGAVQTGVKLYKAAQGAGSAAEDLWQYPRKETIYTIGDPESMARLAKDHPEFAPKTPTGAGVIN